MNAATLEALPADARRELAAAWLPRTPCASTGHTYGPEYAPSEKQSAFMSFTCREALYGGAAGGGKSDALLRAALQYVCVPGYASLLIRQTFPQLSMEGGLIERSQDWLRQTDAEYDKGQKRWTFPSGASLSFDHLERDDDRFKIAGAEFQYIGFDELTNWKTDKVYRFASSRLRRPRSRDGLAACPTCGLTLADVPIRLRAGTNPGSRGEGWVMGHFVQAWLDWQKGDGPAPANARFLPALLHENPGLDADEYEQSLAVLDEQTRAQLRDGLWGMRSNIMLHRERIGITDDWPREATLVRSWDFAGTESDGSNDPDWTVGALVGLHEGRWWLLDVLRTRSNPGDVQSLFLQTLAADAAKYGRVTTVIEQEPGSQGKFVIANLTRLGSGYPVYGQPSLGSKADRAMPLAAAIDNGNFQLVAAAWNEAWLDEAAFFPDGVHDDQVDAVTGAMAYLTKPRKRGGLRA